MRPVRVLVIGLGLVILFLALFKTPKASDFLKSEELQVQRIAFRQLTSNSARESVEPEDMSNVSSDSLRAAISSANQFLLNNPTSFPIKQYHQLASNARQSPLGTQVSYRVFQDNFELIGMQIDLIVGNSGRIRVVSNQYRPIEQVNTDSKSWLSLEEVVESHETFLKLPKRNQDSRLGEVAIWASPQSARAEMVYVVSLVDSKEKYKGPSQAVFSATTGQLLARHFPRSEFQK